jgi:hypothetical protein
LSKSYQGCPDSGCAEGTREAAFGVPMGTVDFYPSVEPIFKDVIKVEFQSAGHTLAKDEQPRCRKKP